MGIRLPAVLALLFPGRKKLLSALLTSPFLEAVFATLCLEAVFVSVCLEALRVIIRRVSFCAPIPLGLLLAAVSVGTVSPSRRPCSGAIRSL